MTGQPSTTEPTLPASEPAPAAPQSPLEGIRGWLVLVALGQVLGPLLLLIETIVYYTDKSTVLAFRKLPKAMYGELIINVGTLAFSVATVILFFKKRRIFKTLFTIEMLGGMIVLVLDSFWLSLVTNLSMSHFLSEQQISDSLRMTILGIFWIIYIWNSRRAENTFVK